MAQPAKFLFDRNLEPRAQASEPPEAVLERRLRRQFESELALARQGEYARGREEGAEAARQSLEARTLEAAGELVASAESLMQRLEQECRAVRKDAVELALAAAERLAGELVRREPTALLEGLFADCLEHLRSEPHIAVRVNDDLAEPLEKAVSAIAAERGFAGRIVVLGDPETARGDCRIEWADGGIERDFDALRASIVRIVQRYLDRDGETVLANGKDIYGEGAGLPIPAAVASPETATTTSSGERA